MKYCKLDAKSQFTAGKKTIKASLVFVNSAKFQRFLNAEIMIGKITANAVTK